MASIETRVRGKSRIEHEGWFLDLVVFFTQSSIETDLAPMTVTLGPHLSKEDAIAAGHAFATDVNAALAGALRDAGLSTGDVTVIDLKNGAQA